MAWPGLGRVWDFAGILQRLPTERRRPLVAFGSQTAAGMPPLRGNDLGCSRRNGSGELRLPDDGLRAFPKVIANSGGRRERRDEKIGLVAFAGKARGGVRADEGTREEVAKRFKGGSGGDEEIVAVAKRDRRPAAGITLLRPQGEAAAPAGRSAQSAGGQRAPPKIPSADSLPVAITLFQTL